MFSRTSEQELRNVFERYGRVQTCIVNKDKRHAFVKMISRADATAAKEAMEKNRTPDSQLRVSFLISSSFAHIVTPNRLDGVLDLAHVIAATTQLVSASFPLASLQMQTANGC